MAFTLNSDAFLSSLAYSVFVGSAQTNVSGVTGTLIFSIGIGVASGSDPTFTFYNNPNTITAIFPPSSLPAVFNGSTSVDMSLSAGQRIVLYLILQQDISDVFATVTFGVNAGLNVSV